MRALAGASSALVAAIVADDPAAAVRASEAHGEAMARLGQAAGAPIVEARLAEIARLARAAGGAAKPSGAGGGDVAVAFFEDPSARARFESACTAAGFSLLTLRLGAEGVRVETEESE
jgi:phosphomevalonate kinase